MVKLLCLVCITILADSRSWKWTLVLTELRYRNLERWEVYHRKAATVNTGHQIKSR